MSHVIVVDVGDSLRDFAAGDSSVQVEHLGPNLVGNVLGGLLSEQLVVKEVAAPDNLHIVQIVGVDSGQANATVVHLPCEDLITEEVVAEDASVRIGIVERLSSGNIN